MNFRKIKKKISVFHSVLGWSRRCGHSSFIQKPRTIRVKNYFWIRIHNVYLYQETFFFVMLYWKVMRLRSKLYQVSDDKWHPVHKGKYRSFWCQFPGLWLVNCCSSWAMIGWLKSNFKTLIWHTGLTQKISAVFNYFPYYNYCFHIL